MQLIYDWARGHLSISERIWSALTPLLLIGCYFLVAYIIYAIRFGRGGFRDRELSARVGLASSPIAHWFLWSIGPMWGLIRRSGIPANAVTSLSFLIAVTAGLAMAMGRFALGGWLFILSGVCDLIDGRLARAKQQAGPYGAALDSILDRYSDAIVMSGLAWYYRSTWVLLPCLVALVGSLMISYTRAKGEGLQAKMKSIGVMQRPERVLLLGLTVALSPILASILAPTAPHPMHWIAVFGILVLAVTTQITATHRFFHLLGVLDDRKIQLPRRRRGTLGRAVISAFIATGMDFALVLLLVSSGVLPPVVATGLGCILGAVINFAINRLWTFDSHGPAMLQGRRYILVSLSSALLNSGGVAVLLLVPDIDYRLAWVLARGLVFVTWNFPLQRDYVFAKDASPAHSHDGLA